MRLVDLGARWIRRDGEPVAIIFRCPRCVTRGTGCGRGVRWLTCTFVAIKQSEQRDLIAAALAGDPEHFAGVEDFEVVGCKFLAWTRDTKLLETISIKPSLDAGDAGHWHGHITNGQIVGGL